MHWRPYGVANIMGGSEDIVVFDTESESFWWMCGPAQPCHYGKGVTGLLAPGSLDSLLS